MSDLQELKSKLDLLDELERDLGPGKKSTRNSRWTLFSCPFPGHSHGDKNPSLAATEDTQTYFCFTCGKAGDVITWLREYRKWGWQEILEQAGNPTLPSLPQPRPKRPVKADTPPAAEWQERASKFIDYCIDQLWSEAGKDALEYLHGRGLQDDVIRYYCLGYYPDGLPDKRESWGLEPDPYGHKVWLPKGITIPCILGESIWYVKIRRSGQLKEGDSKYIHVTGGESALFGASNLLGNEIALLTEGELDCILADQLIGDIAGVATLGSATKRLDILTWGVYLLPARAILAAYDLDKAGKAGLDHLVEKSAQIHPVRVPALKPGDKDITDYHLAGGDLREWLKYNLDRLGVPAGVESIHSA